MTEVRVKYGRIAASVVGKRKLRSLCGHTFHGDSKTPRYSRQQFRLLGVTLETSVTVIMHSESKEMRGNPVEVDSENGNYFSWS